MKRTLKERKFNAWSSVHAACGFDIWNIIEDTEKMDESILTDELKKMSDKYITDLYSSIESPDMYEFEKKQLEGFFKGFYEDEDLYRKAIYEEFITNYKEKYV